MIREIETRKATLQAEITQREHELERLKNGQTDLAAEMAYAQAVVAWRTRAHVTTGDIYAQVESLDMADARLIAIDDLAPDADERPIAMIIGWPDGRRVEILFTGVYLITPGLPHSTEDMAVTFFHADSFNDGDCWRIGISNLNIAIYGDIRSIRETR